ncbi:hypothetical protein FACS189479_06140 [Spirochaetia bacterium]|nr:hypothetical protein FACS189479_06140 [Spirochaetia bacterium]
MSEDIEEGLAELVERGGIFYHVPGQGPEQVLTEIIDRIPAAFLPGGKEMLLRAVLEREALMSTGIGYGLALPHPRNPVISDPEKQFVTIAFPDSPAEWKSLDREPVYAVMLIVSASAKLHLHTLLRVNYFCHQESFRKFLEGRPSRDSILAVIAETEQAWK